MWHALARIHTPSGTLTCRPGVGRNRLEGEWMVNRLRIDKRSEVVLARVRDDLAALLNSSRAPEDVRGFLLQRWARLLADINLSRGEEHPDWVAGWDTVHALLWSLAPKQGLEEVLRLLQLLPLLVERLQDGCEALHLDKTERDIFFANLAMLHAAIVRGGLHPDTAPAQLSEHLESSEVEPLSTFAPSAGNLAESISPVESPGQDVDATINTLLPGARVGFSDVSIEEKQLVLQWVSPMRGMFLFTDVEGYDAVSLTRARLKEKLVRSEARLLLR